ncbi:hypothetical protein ES703_98506 [subsurface metagenome]
MSCESPLRVFLPHGCDESISIQVFRSIFIRDTILVIVYWYEPGSVCFSLVDEIIPAVRVHSGNEIKSSFIQEASGQICFAIILQQIPYGIQCDFRSLNLVAVDVAVNVEP